MDCPGCHSRRKEKCEQGEASIMLNSPSEKLFFTLGSSPSWLLSLPLLGRILILLDVDIRDDEIVVVFLFPYIEHSNMFGSCV